MGSRRKQRILLTTLTIGALTVGVVVAVYWIRTHLWPGTLVGTVTFHGTAPSPTPPYIDAQGRQRLARDLSISASGEVSEALVWIEFTAAGEPAATDRAPEELEFVSDGLSRRVVALGTDQELEIYNRDNLLHNFRVDSKLNRPVNFALVAGSSRSLRFSKTEIPITARCDLHTVEGAVIASFDHTYFAVTDARGRFEITGIPPGTYPVHVWHERLGKLSSRVRIVGGRISHSPQRLPGPGAGER